MKTTLVWFACLAILSAASNGTLLAQKDKKAEDKVKSEPIAKAGKSVATLIRELKDADDAVRLQAAKTLGRLGGDAREAIPALEEAAKDADEDVRRVAVASLVLIRAAATDARVFFGYENDKQAGSFKKTGPDVWTETRHDGSTHNFKEMARNKTYIEIYDALTQVGVQIHRDKTMWRHQQLTEGEWVMQYAGAWRATSVVEPGTEVRDARVFFLSLDKNRFFKMTSPGHWSEKTPNGGEPWREVRRTKDFVELDDSHKIPSVVRIYSDQAIYFKDGNEKSAHSLFEGRWVVGEPTVVEPTTSKAAIRGVVVEVDGDKARVAINKGDPLPKIGDPVHITYEIPGGNVKASVAHGKVVEVRGDKTDVAFVAITAKTAEIRKGYLAEISSTTTGNPSGTGKAVDLSGRWEETVIGLGKSIWTLTDKGNGRYHAQQTGFGNAVGSAILTADVVKIDWKTGNGFEGIREWKLNANHDAGQVQAIGTRGFLGTQTGSIVRLDKAPGNPKNPPVTEPKTEVKDARIAFYYENRDSKKDGWFKMIGPKAWTHTSSGGDSVVAYKEHGRNKDFIELERDGKEDVQVQIFADRVNVYRRGDDKAVNTLGLGRWVPASDPVVEPKTKEKK